MKPWIVRTMLWGATGLVAVVLGLSLSIAIFGPPNSGARVGSFGVAQIGGPFELIDQNGRAVDETLLEGHVSLVYFGFTHCPDICPMDLGIMATAADILKERGAPIQTVFVTVDPERDTPAVMKDYVANFSDEMIGLTGAPDQVAAATQAYKVVARKAFGEEFLDGYTMEHTSLMYAMDAEGRFLRHFTMGTPPEKIADALGGAS